jgi:CspA family cold shock protein
MPRTRTAIGVVREWNDEEGYGVVDSPETPGGCGVVFQMIQMEGYRTLRPGQRVKFTYGAARQDDCDFQAVNVWPSSDTSGH